MRSMQRSAIVQADPPHNALDALSNRPDIQRVSNPYAQTQIAWSNPSSASHPPHRAPPFGTFPAASVHENVVQHGPFAVASVFLRPGPHLIKHALSSDTTLAIFSEKSFTEASLAISVLPRNADTRAKGGRTVIANEASIVDLTDCSRLLSELNTGTEDIYDCACVGTIRQVKVTGNLDRASISGNARQQSKLSMKTSQMAQFGVSVQYEGHSINRNYFVRTNAHDRMRPGDRVYLLRVEVTAEVDTSGKKITDDVLIPIVKNGSPNVDVVGQKREREERDRSIESQAIIKTMNYVLKCAYTGKGEESTFSCSENTTNDAGSTNCTITAQCKIWHIGYVVHPERRLGLPDPNRNMELFEAWTSLGACKTAVEEVDLKRAAENRRSKLLGIGQDHKAGYVDYVDLYITAPYAVSK